MTVDTVSVSVVVPVYGSAKVLPDLYQRLSASLAKIATDWEVIMVDDASPDDSWAVMCALRQRDPRIRVVRLAHNHGQQHATLCGLTYARNRYVFTIDDDLQCLPEDMPKFMTLLQQDKHVVIGKIARSDKRHVWWRNVGSRLNQYLAGRILGKPKNFGLSSYRGMRLEAVRRVVAYKGAHPHIAALLLKSVPRNYLANVDIQHAPRGDGGKGSYSLKKLIRTQSYLLVNHSYLPLRFMAGWGIFISMISMVFAIWVLVRALWWNNVPAGWASLSVLISFLCGNILLALGVVGEYIGRLVEESSKAAQFSVFEEHV